MATGDRKSALLCPIGVGNVEDAEDDEVEFKDEYRSKKNKYVMSHDLTMEEEGRQFERELKVENPAMYSSILTERRT